jgi:hypothetical protein
VGRWVNSCWAAREASFGSGRGSPCLALAGCGNPFLLTLAEDGAGAFNTRAVVSGAAVYGGAWTCCSAPQVLCNRLLLCCFDLKVKFMQHMDPA